MSELNIKGFNVTKDNCYAKSDESGIMFRLNEIMNAVEATVNSIFSAGYFRLPEFSAIDY